MSPNSAPKSLVRPAAGPLPTRREFVKQSLLACASAALIKEAAGGVITPNSADAEAKPRGRGRPMNVMFIVADQLRADCVGCYGNPVVRTPNLDRLATEGLRFGRAYCQHPQGAPSRASFMTGRYPHVNGSLSNYTAMDPAEVTIAEYLRGHGYATSAFGKLHLFEKKSRDSFAAMSLCGGQNSEQRDPEVGAPDQFADTYRPWLKANGHWASFVKMYDNRATSEYREAYQALKSPMSEEAYFDGWVGNQAVEALEKMKTDQPFFMFVSFPNPHNPFEPPEPYASMYRPEDMPLPETYPGDLSAKPPQYLAYKHQARGVNYDNLTPEKLRKVIAYYYASITLVDAQVGKIVDCLTRRGQLDNTLIVFISDHGELLGHHGLLLKTIDDYPFLSDKGQHVPMICRLPGGARGAVVDELVELIDLFPTMAEAAGLPVPPDVQGMSLMNVLRGTGRAPEREFAFTQTSAVKSITGRTHKLAYYPGRPYGELYNLATDPLEKNNLYDSPAHSGLRQDLTRALLDRLILSEAPRHGPSLRGPAYWRKTYTAPLNY